jgi:hypothetical protein
MELVRARRTEHGGAHERTGLLGMATHGADTMLHPQGAVAAHGGNASSAASKEGGRGGGEATLRPLGYGSRAWRRGSSPAYEDRWCVYAQQPHAGAMGCFVLWVRRLRAGASRCRRAWSTVGPLFGQRLKKGNQIWEDGRWGPHVRHSHPIFVVLEPNMKQELSHSTQPTRNWIIPFHKIRDGMVPSLHISKPNTILVTTLRCHQDLMPYMLYPRVGGDNLLCLSWMGFCF